MDETNLPPVPPEVSAEWAGLYRDAAERLEDLEEIDPVNFPPAQRFLYAFYLMYSALRDSLKAFFK